MRPALNVPPLIEIEDLIRTIADQEQPLLRVASLQIQPGDRVGLVGPTGCGKSTLLRAIAMLDPVDRGQLKLAGQVVETLQITAYRRQVVYLAQQPAIYQGSVRDNLQLPFRLAISDESFDEAIVIRWLDRFDRGRPFLDQAADTLSGGERQIVSLIRALQLRPRVLLLDEPTTALDVKLTGRWEQLLLDWLAEEDSQGKAFVVISHDPSQIERLTNTTWEMRSGQLIDL